MEWVMHVFVILIFLERYGGWMASVLILTDARQFTFRHHFKVVCKAHPIFYPVINGAVLEQSDQHVDMATTAL